jgi:hypothetical protein
MVVVLGVWLGLAWFGAIGKVTNKCLRCGDECGHYGFDILPVV